MSYYLAQVPQMQSPTLRLLVAITSIAFSAIGTSAYAEQVDAQRPRLASPASHPRLIIRAEEADERVRKGLGKFLAARTKNNPDQ